MTYENALDYLTRNIPMELYDNYNDWYNACKNEIQTPSLWGSPSFNRMHEQEWLNNFGTLDNPQMKGIETEMPEQQPIEQFEREEISKRPPSSYREPEQEYYVTREPITIEKVYVEERERVIPETGQAPKITLREYNMNVPQQRQSLFKRLFRNPFRRNR